MAYHLISVVMFILYDNINPQSSGTEGIGTIPPSLLTLSAQSRLAVYKLYYHSTWTLSLSFCINQDF